MLQETFRNIKQIRAKKLSQYFRTWLLHLDGSVIDRKIILQMHFLTPSERMKKVSLEKFE